MKLSRMKSIVFGIIIGVLTTASITVVGISLATPRVEVWLQTQDISIIVDGRTLSLPEGAHILNFNGRVHVPARVIAESLGATVQWDEPSQTVIIVSADPTVIEREIEVPVEVPAPPDPAVIAARYSPLPMRRVQHHISMNITAMEFFLSQTEVILDFESRSQWPILFLREQTYMEFRGEKFPVDYIFNPIFSNSLPNNYSRDDMRLTFAPLPEDIIRSGEDVDQITVVITIEVMERAFFADDPSRILRFEFNIDPSDEPFYDWRR